MIPEHSPITRNYIFESPSLYMAVMWHTISCNWSVVIYLFLFTFIFLVYLLRNLMFIPIFLDFFFNAGIIRLRIYRFKHEGIITQAESRGKLFCFFKLCIVVK